MKRLLCINTYEVKVLKSAAGYYIGTHDEDGAPNCRLSVEYYKTKEEAEKAFKELTFTTRSKAPENVFCHKGMGCFGGGKNA